MDSTPSLNGTITEWRTATGVLHREDGPAQEFATGEQIWFYNGEIHRDNGPAIISHSFHNWYEHGQRYRSDFFIEGTDTVESVYHKEGEKPYTKVQNKWTEQ